MMGRDCRFVLIFKYRMFFYSVCGHSMRQKFPSSTSMSPAAGTNFLISTNVFTNAAILTEKKHSNIWTGSGSKHRSTRAKR